jgi:drug/metabolite transporter (DMT)-like permease
MRETSLNTEIGFRLMYYLLFSILCFSIADSLWKIPLRYIEAHTCIFYRNIGTSTLFALAWIFFGQNNANLYTATDVLVAVGVSCIAFGGLYCFGKAQIHTELSLLIPLLSFGEILKFLIGTFFWGESVSLSKASIFVLSLLANLLMLVNPKKNFKFYDKSLIYALLAATFWSISYSFFKYNTEKLGAIPFGFILEVVAVVLSLAVHKLQKRQWEEIIKIKHSTKVLPSIALIAVLGGLGVYFTNMAYQSESITSIVIIGLIGQLIPLGMGTVFYHERLRPLQYLGVFLSLLAFVLLNIYQSN